MSDCMNMHDMNDWQLTYYHFSFFMNDVTLLVEV